MPNRKISQALKNIDRKLGREDSSAPISFDAYLQHLLQKPQRALRNIFQLFHDMIKEYMVEVGDEYPDDPESIKYLSYDCSRLFVEDSDRPFFADRLFANRLVGLAEAMERSAQQNRIYVFEGPHGSGKSTFLNNLLQKFEAYTNSEAGCNYEVVWRLDRQLLGKLSEKETSQLLGRLSQMLDKTAHLQTDIIRAQQSLDGKGDYVDVPCPSHDNPIMILPKELRRNFLDDLFANDKKKWKIFTAKEYEWLFRAQPCTICASIYQALLHKLGSPYKVFKMVYARPYRFNRRLGEGISVFSPGDKPTRETVQTNPFLQSRIDELLRDSNQVKYLYSRFAKTNNGIYALMDLKGHNKDRLIELHNIISEGLHKVEDIEENVHSLFIALCNPEDRSEIDDVQSFTDRVETVKIPYVLDLQTEVEIYRHIFGRHIDEAFLPRVLHNFARVIIATRLEPTSRAMLDWIEDPKRYQNSCDVNLLLLKMEIFTGYIPEWLSTEDRRRLTAKRRRRIIAESESEGSKGLSGRDSIRIFNELHSSFARKDQLIDMALLKRFCTKLHPEIAEALPDGFLDSLLGMYDYTVLQEVKESLFYYNEEEIIRELQNYLFALNFDFGTEEKNQFTGDRIRVSEEFLAGVEIRLLSKDVAAEQRQKFRSNTQREYASTALTQQVMVDGLSLTQTDLFHRLLERYQAGLKEKALDPFLENENFRRAIKDFGKDDFRTYDRRIQDDVSYLMSNLCEKHDYTRKGAKEVCIYVIDNDLAKKFSP